MVALKKYNVQGQEVGQVTISDSLANATANPQMVKDYIVAIQNNKRQWSACTKGRAEVAHTTKKPHAQKGTGNARQGMLVAPQFRGGGIVFGPKPKFNQHTRINKKERMAAIRALLGDKIRNDNLVILESTQLEEPKTKTVADFMKALNIEGRVLFLGEGNNFRLETDEYIDEVSLVQTAHHNFSKSVRNIPKTSFALAKNINGYDVMVNKKIVMTEAALNEIENWLCQSVTENEEG